MADDIIDLRSVNWSQGMFLTPDHFLRQERYFDSVLLWLVRHALNTSGLIGGGPRVDAAERGAARFDPIVEVDETADSLRIAVTQCRGMTSGGAIVDIDPGRPLNATISRRDLEGTLDVGIYVVARPHAKEPDSGVPDPINPQLDAGRRYSYSIKLDLQADEAEWALLLTRLRRAEKGLRFERVVGFIPPCAFMSSHTGLMEAFRQLNESVASIADRYSLLHRAMVDYIALAKSRGITVDHDEETLEFVSRMVLTLEQCAYAVLNPLQPPSQFFQELNRVVRSAALFLSLSPPTREYFSLLAEIGEDEFASILVQEGEALDAGRRRSVHEDLSQEVQRVRRALDGLFRLEQALEGKYLDYRVSPSLENLNFVFDRTAGDPVLYKSVSRPARPQAHGQDLTFVFAPLRLESRETYRVILIGDKQAQFTQGDRLGVEIWINPGEGTRQDPDRQRSEYEIEGQRNFAIDFRAPENVLTITNVRVTLRSSQPIRSAILYVRGRLFVGARTPTTVHTGSAPFVPQTPLPTKDDRVAGVQGSGDRRRGRLQEEPYPNEQPDPPVNSGPRRRLS